MVFFLSKKETKRESGESLTKKIKDFLNRGFKDVEIIDLLRKEGYPPEEISKAFFQILEEEKKSQSVDSQKKGTEIQQEKDNLSLGREEYHSSTEGEAEAISERASTTFQVDYITLEELVEHLLREKMEETNKRLIETSVKFKDLEQKIADIKDEIGEIGKENKDDISRILNEIKINRDAINDLSIKVETLSKTLKELLPPLIESVRLLSEIVQKLKV